MDKDNMDKDNMINALIYSLTIIVIIIVFIYPFRNNTSIIEYEMENFMNNN